MRESTMTEHQALIRLQRELERKNVAAEIFGGPPLGLRVKIGRHTIIVEVSTAVHGHEMFGWIDEIGTVHRTSFVDTVAQLWRLTVGYTQGSAHIDKEEQQLLAKIMTGVGGWSG
jgi:hypothetical protein